MVFKIILIPFLNPLVEFAMISSEYFMVRKAETDF
jgi:hypothetical protein